MKNPVKALVLANYEHKKMLPLTFLKPFCELRMGLYTFTERMVKLWEPESIGYLVPSYLNKLYPSLRHSDYTLINAHVFPYESFLEEISNLSVGEGLMWKESFIAARLDDSYSFSYDSPGWLLKNLHLKQTKAENVLIIDRPWKMFQYNGQAIAYDLPLAKTHYRKVKHLDGVYISGEDLYVAEGVLVHPGTVINTHTGPVILEAGAEVMEGALIRGPLVVGRGTQIKMGAKIYGPTTIGPGCKVGGEVNNSIFIGNSNKAHDGFIGNSVIGEWCNLGADTNTSNLKNNYSHVKVWSYAEETMIDTGLQFCGLVMGDHSKSAINTQFNTGTVCGIFANIFQEGFPPKYIPSFSWGGQKHFEKFQLDKAIEMAQRMMLRRNVQPTTDYLEVIKFLHNQILP